MVTGKTVTARQRLVQQRIVKWATFTTPPICRQCQIRPVLCSLWICGNARCTTCWNRRPSVRRAVTMYRQHPQRQALARAVNARRVFLGNRYLGKVSSAEHAAALNAHIRSRLTTYVAQQRQSAGAQAESRPARAVSIEANH